MYLHQPPTSVACRKASPVRVCCCGSYETGATHEGVRHWPVARRGQGCARSGRRVSAHAGTGTAAEPLARCPVHPTLRQPCTRGGWIVCLQTRRWGFRSCPRAGGHLSRAGCMAGRRSGATREGGAGAWGLCSGVASCVPKGLTWSLGPY